LFDKAKVKLIMGLLEELTPDLEIRIEEKVKVKFAGEEPKEWFAVLIRSKKTEKDEPFLCGSTETSSEGKER